MTMRELEYVKQLWKEPAKPTVPHMFYYEVSFFFKKKKTSCCVFLNKALNITKHNHTDLVY